MMRVWLIANCGALVLYAAFNLLRFFADKGDDIDSVIKRKAEDEPQTETHDKHTDRCFTYKNVMQMGAGTS